MKEVEGKLTGDESRAEEAKARGAIGEVNDKAGDAWDTTKDKFGDKADDMIDKRGDS